MSGFVLLARKIQDNSIWRRDPDHLKLFLYLLINANYKEDKVYTYHSGDDVVKVGYAQYLCSYSKISKDCQYSAGNKLICWQPSRVNRMLKAIEEDGRIKPMGVSRERLVPVLVKAIQELSEKVESQQKEIEELKK